MKKILDLTYVEYPSEDGLMGFTIAVLSLLPFAIFCAMISIFLYSRDLRFGFVVIGLLISTIANEVTKRIVMQERPIGSHKLGYGMPSDHSQFMAFWFVFTFLYFRDSRTFQQWFFKLATTLNAGIVGIVVYSRIYLGVHSLPQVIVGFSCGCFFGLFWSRFACNFQHSQRFKSVQISINRIWAEKCLLNKIK
jgi:dolichyldiphosphatase